MIRLTGIGQYDRVFVFGSGPSRNKLRREHLGGKLTERDLVISCNTPPRFDSTDKDGSLAFSAYFDLINQSQCAKVILTVDAPTARDQAIPAGTLGIYVRLGDVPLPKFSQFQTWVPCTTGADHWSVERWGDYLDPENSEVIEWGDPVGLTVGGGAGCAALNLAYIVSPKEVRIYGLDGGGRYEAMRPGLERGAKLLRSRYTKVYDAAGRL